MEVEGLHRFVNNMNSKMHVKTLAIPANNPTITPAMRRVGASELEVGTGTSEVGVQKLCVDKCTPAIAIATHLMSLTS